jgi:hypothetical protein
MDAAQLGLPSGVDPPEGHAVGERGVQHGLLAAPVPVPGHLLGPHLSDLQRAPRKRALALARRRWPCTRCAGTRGPASWRCRWQPSPPTCSWATGGTVGAAARAASRCRLPPPPFSQQRARAGQPADGTGARPRVFRLHCFHSQLCSSAAIRCSRAWAGWAPSGAASQVGASPCPRPPSPALHRRRHRRRARHPAPWPPADPSPPPPDAGAPAPGLSPCRARSDRRRLPPGQRAGRRAHGAHPDLGHRRRQAQLGHRAAEQGRQGVRGCSRWGPAAAAARAPRSAAGRSAWRARRLLRWRAAVCGGGGGGGG